MPRQRPLLGVKKDASLATSTLQRRSSLSLKTDAPSVAHASPAAIPTTHVCRSMAAMRNPRGHSTHIADNPDICLDRLLFASMLLRRLEDAGRR
ncbi:hypothetical protein IHQ72_06630 [Mesorhizobium onobrychidis]|uniref:Uncharacterized protein n=1 Tax=Mesorhizobium onobrychidis TaxID=2775404 RepID=A0ABY5R1Q1_9HYPH|nr:hypothetical protein IHQ72_06630 [Mesorhizobium onobrychidis]